jgi:tRNA A37 threonylcarbamoyladenosine biosynthesis protein TsaE
VEEARAIGLDEMLNESNAIVLIEWPERLDGWLIPQAYAVMIRDKGTDMRELEIVRNNELNGKAE